jgi:transcription initiation factor IIE alpha subunit
MIPPDPPPVRPYLCDRVHAALVKAGRPVTRGEVREYYLSAPSKIRTADVQAALDALEAEGLAVRGEERDRRWTHVVWRAVGEGER